MVSLRFSSLALLFLHFTAIVQSQFVSSSYAFQQVHWQHFNVLGGHSCSVDGNGIVTGLGHLLGGAGTFTDGQNWYEYFVSTLPGDLWAGATSRKSYCEAFATADDSQLNGRVSPDLYEGGTNFGDLVNDLNQQIDALIANHPELPYAYAGVTVIDSGYADLIRGEDPSVTVPNIFGQLGRLSDAGFKNLAVFNMVPLDHYPLMTHQWFNDPFGGEANARAAYQSRVSLFNGLLQSELPAFLDAHPDTQLQIIDMHGFIMDAINNPGDYGLTDVVTPCVDELRDPQCPDSTGMLFFDIHSLTSEVHAQISPLLVEPLFEECWAFDNRVFTSVPMYFTDRAEYLNEIMHLHVGIPTNYFDVKFWYEGDGSPGTPAYNDVGELPYREQRIEDGENLSDYPWRMTHESCYDVYQSVVHWGDLLDGGAHLVRDDNATAPMGWDATSVSGVLYSTAKEYKGEIRSEPIFSEISSRFPFTVYFPQGVEIVSGDCEHPLVTPPDAECNVTEIIRVYDNANIVDVLATQVVYSTKFVDEQEVDVEVRIFTSVQWPFMLVPTGTSSDVPQIDNPDLRTTYLEMESDCDEPGVRFADDDIEESERPNPCQQWFQIDMRPNAGLVEGVDPFVCEIDGTYTVDFDLVCQHNFTDNCPIDDDAMFEQLQFTLDSESWCAVVDFGVTFDGEITAYRNPLRDVASLASHFMPDFIDYEGVLRKDIVYFQVELFSTEHVIQHTSLKTIYIESGGDTRYLLADGFNYAALMGWAEDFAYADLVQPANGEDPRNTCWFEFNMDPKLYTIPMDDHIIATITVELAIQYENNPTQQLLSISRDLTPTYESLQPITGEITILNTKLIDNVEDYVHEDTTNENPAQPAKSSSSTLSTLFSLFCIVCVIIHV